MGRRSAAGVERERRRARSVTKLVGVPDGQEATTGHPALLDVRPAFELGRIPEGGGYPVGFVQTAARILGCADVGQILHLCLAEAVHLHHADQPRDWRQCELTPCRRAQAAVTS